jgi:hypothetical protein
MTSEVITKYNYYRTQYNRCSWKWCIVHVVGHAETIIHQTTTYEEADRLMKLLRE